MTLNFQWENFNPPLNNEICEILTNSLNFPNVTLVQKQAIGMSLENKDVAVEAATGSGKTLAFLIPIFNSLIKLHKKVNKFTIFSLIIAPTRGLAKQIYDVAFELLKPLNEKYNFSLISLLGGVNTNVDIENFQKNGGNIVIGTPGKLLEILQIENEKSFGFSFKNLEHLILDEADRLFESEFSEAVKKIVSYCPKQRRTGLFSATLTSQKLSEIQWIGLRNPKSDAKKEGYTVPDSLKNYYIQNDSRVEKIHFIYNLIFNETNKKVLIFFNTCASVAFYGKIFENLNKKKSILYIHGHMKQKKRNNIIAKYFEIKHSVLFATDVVARGMDFKDIEIIVQVDPPQEPESFVHRIGRTARVGKVGEAIILLQKNEEMFLDYLKMKNIEIEIKFNEYGKENLEEIKSKIKNLVISDRDLIEKGKSAFVSFVRSYKEHELKYIFEFKKLDLGDLANSFFLLRIPRIKEILGKSIKNFAQSDLDIETIPFKDKNQKKQFLQKKEVNVNKKVVKNAEKFEKKNKLKQEKQKNTQNIKNKSSLRRKMKKDFDYQEFLDMGKEANLIKKIKSGKISKEKIKEKMLELDGFVLSDEEKI